MLIPNKIRALSPMANATVVTRKHTTNISINAGKNFWASIFDFNKLNPNIIATPTMYVADTATNGLLNSTNGTNHNADVKTYAMPVITPRHMAVVELPPAFCDKYSDAVMDNPADTAAIIPVSIIMYCVASANANPVTSPNVETNASCIPKTSDDQTGSFFFMQKNYPHFGGKYTGQLSEPYHVGAWSPSFIIGCSSSHSARPVLTSVNVNCR